jgi:hypothetical protein
MADCKSIRYELDLLLNEKKKYELAIWNMSDRIQNQIKKLNTCQNEAKAMANARMAEEKSDYGGKRHHTKRYKKSKKSKRRFTRSKIRV